MQDIKSDRSPHICKVWDLAVTNNFPVLIGILQIASTLRLKACVN